MLDNHNEEKWESGYGHRTFLQTPYIATVEVQFSSLEIGNYYVYTTSGAGPAQHDNTL